MSITNLFSAEFISVAIFIIAYAIIVWDKFPRTVVAMIAAMLIFFLGLLDFSHAMETYIAWETIFLLVGMMVIAGIAAESGFFDYLAIKIVKLSKGRGILLMIAFGLFIGIGSALLDDITMILIMVPLAFSICRMLNMNLTPFLILIIFAASIGGSLTLVGDNVTIIVSGANPQLTFLDFVKNMIIPAILALTTAITLLFLFYRKSLSRKPENINQLMALDEKSYIKDRKLATISLIILGVVLFLFFIHNLIHIPPAVIALLGASALMLLTTTTDHDVDLAFNKVEWSVIFFLFAFFIIIGAMVETGVISDLAQKFAQFSQDNMQALANATLIVSGLISLFVENIVLVSTFIPLLQEVAEIIGIDPYSETYDVIWWALIMGVLYGGNGTIISSSAAIVTSQLSQSRDHKISFLEFAKIGIPVALISLFLSFIYLNLAYFIF